jgi:hypothetical protein
MQLRMSKEFNINNYKYEEEHIRYSDWVQGYRPQVNHLKSDAAFGGLLFEHEGDQWDYVVAQVNQLQWTLYRDDEGVLRIRNGLQVRGRLGYFICSNMHNSHATILVGGFPESELTRAACGI